MLSNKYIVFSDFQFPPRHPSNSMKFSSAIVFTAVVAIAAACSCTPPKSCLVGFTEETTPMMKATAVRVMDVPNSQYSWTIFKHNVQFRGCKPTGEYFIVKSPKSASLCGVAFKKNVCYLITARMAGSSTPPPTVYAVKRKYNLDVYSTTYCAYNAKWSSVPFADKKKIYDAPVKGCAVA